MNNNLLRKISRKLFFYGLFLFYIDIASAMQPAENYFALAERFINDAAQTCDEIIKNSKKNPRTHSDSSSQPNYLEPRRDFLTALQQLLNAHDAGHKTSLFLAKQVFEIVQKLESIKLKDRRGRPLSLSPEIVRTVSKFRTYNPKREEISWQEFMVESCQSKDYADYGRLQKIIAKSMDLLLHA